MLSASLNKNTSFLPSSFFLVLEPVSRFEPSTCQHCGMTSWPARHRSGDSVVNLSAVLSVTASLAESKHSAWRPRVCVCVCVCVCSSRCLGWKVRDVCVLEICLPEHPHTRVASWSKSGGGVYLNPSYQGRILVEIRVGGGCLPEPLIPGSYLDQNPGGIYLYTLIPGSYPGQNPGGGCRGVYLKTLIPGSYPGQNPGGGG